MFVQRWFECRIICCGQLESMSQEHCTLKLNISLDNSQTFLMYDTDIVYNMQFQITLKLTVAFSLSDVSLISMLVISALF